MRSNGKTGTWRWTTALVLLAAVLGSGVQAAPARRGAARSGGSTTLAAVTTSVNMDKVSLVVQSKMATEPNRTLDLIVTYDTRPGSSQHMRLLTLGGGIQRELGGVDSIAVRLTPKSLEKLVNDLDVESVTLDATVFSSTTLSNFSTSRVPDPSSSGGESDSFAGAGVTVAVIDSGYHSHPDLDGRVIHAESFLTSGNTDDAYGHGTHVAGIIAGSGAGSAGRYRGVAPAADIVSLRVLDDQGQGQTSDVIAALEWVLDHGSEYGIDVVNLSLGHPVMEPAELDPLVQAVEAVWNAGIVVVCSAGNRGADGNFTINSPGNSPLVLTVGSLTDWHTPSTADDKVSSFSSRGPTAVDHVLKPDFVAPGNRVVSATSASSALAKALPQSLTGGPDAAYLELSGTSMAAAEVSGVVARMLQQDPTLNPATVKSRLVDTAREVAGALPTDTGAGALDMGAALAASGFATSAYSPTVVRSDVEGVLELHDATTGGPTAWSDMTLWSDAGLWSDAVLWSDAALWSDAGLWSDGTPVGD